MRTSSSCGTTGDSIIADFASTPERAIHRPQKYPGRRFDFGDSALEGGTAIVPEGTNWEDEDYDGTLGRDILSTFDLLFDYANHRLYVRM